MTERRGGTTTVSPVDQQPQPARKGARAGGGGGLVGGLRWRLPAHVFTDVVCGCAAEQRRHEYHPQATVALHQLSEEHRGNLVNRNKQNYLARFRCRSVVFLKLGKRLSKFLFLFGELSRETLLALGLFFCFFQICRTP